MREEGFEPSRAFAHGILSPARLPVPPLSRSSHRRSNRMRIQRRAVTVFMMSKTLVSLGIAAFALGIFAEATITFGDQKVDPRIFAGRAAFERASFLVVLRDQADLSGAESIADSTERVRFVYESLRA